MAARRRAIELSLGDLDVEKLRLIARSRTEPASRVERARILLGHSENSSFFAVGQALGAAPPNGPALRRAGGGRRPDGRAGRYRPRPGRAAFHHAGSESLVDIAVVPEGEGAGLSA